MLGVAMAPWLGAQNYFTGAGQTASGSLTAADATAGDSACGSTKCVELFVGSTQGSVATVAWQISGTFVGTVVEEGTVDGTNWVTLAMLSPTTITACSSCVNGLNWVSSATAAGVFSSNIAGYSEVHIRCSAFTSGTIVVFGRSSSGALGPQ
jgi:hypothetical protein